MIKMCSSPVDYCAIELRTSLRLYGWIQLTLIVINESVKLAYDICYIRDQKEIQKL